MAVSDTYTVTYSATDADGNIGTESRTVIVDDTVAPVITLTNGDIGTTNYTVERGTTYVDPGAAADGGETVTVDTSELNMAVSGTYTVRYSATDADGNIGTANRIVIVDDTIAPVITLSGANPYTVERGTTYVDPGATANGGETVTVNTSGLNMAVSDTYTVTYSATDADGNIGTETRIVIVDDTIAPVITLSGANPYLVPEAGSFSDPGATADGGETVSINTSNLNSIQTSGGNGDVVYSAADAAGNIGYAIRTVKYLVRQPASGYQHRTSSPKTYYAYPANCPGHRIFWNDILVYNSTSAPSFPITINGWTYYMGFYISTAPATLCGLPPGPDGFYTHELYRVGYL
jgi:hypothetical protein